MSGGVDSTVSALMLKNQGYDVFGISLILSDFSQDEGRFLDSVNKAAGELCIELQIRDLRHQFKKEVIDYFVGAYEKGLTPNPCIVCNHSIKFGTMLEEAMTSGADYLATGHYARVEEKKGTIRLLKGLDKEKDQSYFLYRLQQKQLKHLLFPLGGYLKPQVRQMARDAGLQSAEKKESQDLCFVNRGGYRELYLQETKKESVPGPIVDLTGKKLGIHKGLWNYTIGQRRGIGVSFSEPIYVTRIDIANNTLVVATDNQRGIKVFEAGKVNYIKGVFPTAPFPAMVKIRYSAEAVDARVIPFSEEVVKIELERPLPDVTPGQSVIFYDGEEMLGGGIIT